MSATLVKCQVKGCERDQFINQLVDIPLTDKSYQICPDCWNELKTMIGNKFWLGSLYKGMVMSPGECQRLRLERGLSYARKDFNFRGM